MISYDKYKQNLRATGNAVYSYNTKVAEIDHKSRTITPLGWWSVTTSKHINYVGAEYGYEVQEIKPKTTIKEEKSKFPYYVDVPLSVDASGNIIEWANTKISDEEEERDIITTAEKLIERNESK